MDSNQHIARHPAFPALHRIQTCGAATMTDINDLERLGHDPLHGLTMLLTNINTKTEARQRIMRGEVGSDDIMCALKLDATRT